MRVLNKFIAFALFTLFFKFGYGQSAENAGWFFMSNTHQLSERFDLLTDVQLRSAESFEYYNTLLLRGALSLNLNKQHSVALGYAYKGDWEYDEGKRIYSYEQRIYEQYLYDFKVGRIETNVRARLEQRFVNEDNHVLFSQRLRAFISAQIPLISHSKFTTGLYTGIQNEVFLNAQNKANVNKSVFDQNRSFFSLGYRFSKKFDIEFGYMYWLKKNEDQNTRTNVWQLMITTKF